MRFYLGVHQPHWMRETSVPLFVSHNRLRRYKTLPKAAGTWCLDSGGFTQLSTHGSWVTSVSEYAEATERYVKEVGMLEWASPQDWMCEPSMLESTGLSVREHQERTVENYLDLRDRGPFVPVLQGWTVDEYLRCADLYASAGVDLPSEPVVGLGTVCRRQDTRAAERLVMELAPLGLRLHGYGIKTTGLRRYGYAMQSADSMAWSFAGRKRGPCVRGCANHLHYALEWRERVLRQMDYQQLQLPQKVDS